MNDEKYTFETGYTKIERFSRIEGNRLCNYCVSVKFDSNGIELSRTEPRLLTYLEMTPRLPWIERLVSMLGMGKNKQAMK